MFCHHVGQLVDSIVFVARLVFHVQTAAKPPITEVSAGVLPLPLHNNYFETICGEKGLFYSSFLVTAMPQPLYEMHGMFQISLSGFYSGSEMTEFQFSGWRYHSQRF